MCIDWSVECVLLEGAAELWEVLKSAGASEKLSEREHVQGFKEPVPLMLHVRVSL